MVKKTWVRLTNIDDGNFLAKRTIGDVFGGLRKMKRVLSIEVDVPDLD